MRWFLACANGAVLCAAMLLAWLSMQPFVGGGPTLTAVLGTLLLGAAALGSAMALLLRLRRQRHVLAGLLWWLAGAWLLLAQTTQAALLELLEPYGLMAAVAVGFIALFVPPILLLVALLLLEPSQETPRAVRLTLHLLLAALSAALTFAALVAVGIERLGVSPWLTITAIACCMCGTLLLLSAATTARRRIGLGSVIVVFISVGSALPHPGPNVDGLRTLQHTGTHELRVLDQGDYRTLLVDGEPLIAVDPSTGDAEAPDPSTLELMLQFFWPPGRALLLGMPEPQFVRDLAQRGWTIDIAADAVLLDLACEHLGLDAALYETVSPREVRRALLRRAADPAAQHQSRRYQIIVVQLRGAARSAQPFATRRGIETLRRMLVDDGVLLLRLEAPAWRHPWPQALAAALLRQFPEVWALPVSGGPRNAGALVLAASDRVLEIRDHLLPSPQDHPNHPEAQLQSGRARNAWRYRFVPTQPEVPPLELDHNPAPYWLEEFHQADRQRLHRRLGGRGLTW